MFFVRQAWLSVCLDCQYWRWNYPSCILHLMFDWDWNYKNCGKQMSVSHIWRKKILFHSLWPLSLLMKCSTGSQHAALFVKLPWSLYVVWHFCFVAVEMSAACFVAVLSYSRPHTQENLDNEGFVCFFFISNLRNKKWEKKKKYSNMFQQFNRLYKLFIRHYWQQKK